MHARIAGIAVEVWVAVMLVWHAADPHTGLLFWAVALCVPAGYAADNLMVDAARQRKVDAAWAYARSMQQQVSDYADKGIADLEAELRKEAA